ncbi:ATP-binding cassette domain-containing protein, partial [Cutibacterium acnes]
MGHLDVATVSYTLPDGRPLLRNVAFSLGTGEQVAVVGANGAGKSTLLRIVMGQLSP